MSRFLLLFVVVFLLNACDTWDDIVDSVSGSGDDKSTTTDDATPADTDDSSDSDDSSGSDDDEGTLDYETRFHHTATGSSDGGKSLVLCPGQNMGFDSCKVGDVTIPKHSDDEGRETYWNMSAEPAGDIVCKKGGDTYKYPADSTIVMGDCD